MKYCNVHEYMDKLVYDIFVVNDKDMYQGLISKWNMKLPDHIKVYCESSNICYECDARDLVLEDPEPSLSWSCVFKAPEFNNNGYSMRYHTVLHVSKIAKIYYIESFFSFDDPDPDALYDLNEGDMYSGIPTTKTEATLCSLLNEWLLEIGYFRLEKKDACKKIIGLKDMLMWQIALDCKNTTDEYPEELYYPSYFEVFFLRDVRDLIVQDENIIKLKSRYYFK